MFDVADCSYLYPFLVYDELREKFGDWGVAYRVAGNSLKYLKELYHLTQECIQLDIMQKYVSIISYNSNKDYDVIDIPIADADWFVLCSNSEDSIEPSGRIYHIILPDDN